MLCPQLYNLGKGAEMPKLKTVETRIFSVDELARGNKIVVRNLDHEDHLLYEGIIRELPQNGRPLSFYNTDGIGAPNTETFEFDSFDMALCGIALRSGRRVDIGWGTFVVTTEELQPLWRRLLVAVSNTFKK